MADFIQSLTNKLAGRGIEIGKFYDSANLVEKRIVKEYGAVFLNADAPVRLPPRCRFKNESEVESFQGAAKTVTKAIGGHAVELQEAAMNALLKAQAKAGTITPKGGNPAKRSFATVQSSWDAQVRAGAKHWRTTPNKNQKKLSAEDAHLLQNQVGEVQIKRVLELEAENFFFHPDFTRSIAVYTAIPGASQHLLMLALDIAEYTDKKVRDALAENGWFQTVFRDRPHFTYLGLKQSDLLSLGLKMEKFEGREFWIPDL